MDIQSLRKSVRLHDHAKQAEEGSISNIITINPIALDVNDSDVIEVGNFYLPYSTGFEIECHRSELYNEKNFTSIPYILDVDNCKDEHRFRIPSGIEGLQCLYNICMQLQINNVLTDSGIHYHIDCTDLKEYEGTYDIDKFQHHKELILTELDTWEYKGSYNRRAVDYGHTWIRLNEAHTTVECRIGEMSFDYNVLLKRILHLNGLFRYVKNEIIEDYFLKNDVSKLYDGDNIEEILKNRNKTI